MKKLDNGTRLKSKGSASLRDINDQRSAKISSFPLSKDLLRLDFAHFCATILSRPRTYPIPAQHKARKNEIRTTATLRMDGPHKLRLVEFVPFKATNAATPRRGNVSRILERIAKAEHFPGISCLLETEGCSKNRKHLEVTSFASQKWEESSGKQK